MEHTDSPTAALEAFGDTLEQLSDLMTSLTQMENAKAEAFLSPLFGRLTEQLRLLTSSRDSANRILNVRLKEFEDALAGSPQPHFRDTYV